MKRKPLIFSLLFFVCINNTIAQEIQEKNFATFEEFLIEQNNNISKIKNGLNKAEVKEIMGASIRVKIPKIGRMKALNQVFKQPEYLNEFNRNTDRKLTILWYFSTPKDQNGIISKRECTPILIENDSVAGKGWTFFNTYRKKHPIR